ncbi:signal transduction histidine kinase [Asanoa ferruginea]|uniref:histidine kinase n=1 Tax=Asanoa ferruginea TaxID=53367 RepID=A0A3D9ZLP8_9ACTN|nr:sensor histidine kinase [Asanoa ferruginea]REF97432.1 signal transduction histidine kinase [Asanoa ferruginea]GIF48284.1 histidine kinase [Asanoa ferruginea]
MILLRVWATARMWRELAFVLVTALLSVATFALALLGIAAGALSVVIFGLFLLAGVLFLARGSSRYFRVPARRFLDWDWPDPPPLGPRSRWGRIVAVLGDSTAWRALCYCFVSFPLIFAGAYGVAIAIVSGLLALTYPGWWFLWPNPLNSLDAHTWGQTWLEAGRGALLLLALPWFVRLIVLADRWLVRGLLNPTRAARRIAQLEAGRAALQADAAAVLRRVERDLHDSTQARLVSLGVALSRIEHRSTEQPVRDVAADARGTVTEALAELRDIVRGLHPPALDDGLDVALSTLAGRSAVPASVTVELTRRPPDAIASAVYFTVAELLTNIARHASASRVRISLRDGSDLTLVVHDDGRGGATANGTGTGLAGLTRRAEALDGALHIESPAGGPTTITMTLPREP